MEIDIEEVMDCTCLGIRRAARRITQTYDQALEPVGLTVNQFGLLTHLYGASIAGLRGWSIGVLAERLGTDPTTLNRTLKPLQAKSLIRDEADPVDRRRRILSITVRGRTEVRKALPLWRGAQAQLETALGSGSIQHLNELLHLTWSSL